MTLINAPSWTGTPSGTNVYAYPLSNTYPIAQWTTHRVLLTDQEGSRPISLDNTKGEYWGLYEGNTQPASKSLAVAVVSLEENSTAFPSGLTVAIPAVLQNAGYDPTNIVKYRGTTWVITIENLGVLDNADDIWFTLRRRQSDVESASLVQINLVTGLLISNGVASTTSSNGSLAVTDDITGIVTIILKPVETTKYLPMQNLNYDLKVLRSDGSVDIIHESNKFSIERDVTRRIT
jgi:hypothetical protein